MKGGFNAPRQTYLSHDKEWEAAYFEVTRGELQINIFPSTLGSLAAALPDSCYLFSLFVTLVFDVQFKVESEKELGP